MPTDGINRYLDTADYLSKFQLDPSLSPRTVKHASVRSPTIKVRRDYQREFLKHVKECFVDTTNTNTSSSVLPPKTEPRDQDNLLPPSNVIKTEEMKHEPDQKDLSSIVKVEHNVIEDDEDSITETVTTIFSPVIEVENDSVVYTTVRNTEGSITDEDDSKEHRSFCLLKDINSEFLPFVTEFPTLVDLPKKTHEPGGSYSRKNSL